MKEIQLYLTPQPGAKPEFLATLVPAVAAAGATLPSELYQQLPPKLVLEGYTRDGWAWKPSPALHSMVVQSIDGRKKLPGFLNYLKQRQKSAYGRIQIQGMVGMVTVPFVQKSSNNNTTNAEDVLEIRIARDLRTIPSCTIPATPTAQPAAAGSGAVSAASPTVSASVSKNSPKPLATKKPGGVGGLLGKLVGAQQRTNQHMAVATGRTTKAATSPANTNTNCGAVPAAETKTSAQVLAEFRQAMQDQMLEFDLDTSTVMEVNINLATHQAGLSQDDKARVTMDVLKYMVYEAAEEVNEEWIAYKQPSEFIDEQVICVYKEGAAPPEVLEEINKGELPDEVRQQQQALAQERLRQVQVAQSKSQQRVLQEAHNYEDDEDEDDDLEALNTKKRDRRTIEDYEREKRAGGAGSLSNNGNSSKRNRSS